jgi:hypothetical protein
MDLTLEEDDFDSLLWDNDDDDKDVTTQNNELPGDDQLDNSHIAIQPNSNNEYTQAMFMNNNNNENNNNNNNQTSCISLQQPWDSMNQPYLNTFISAMADNSTSQGQSVQSNVLNASNGLPLLFTSDGVTNQDKNCSSVAGMTSINGQQGTNYNHQVPSSLSMQNYQMEPIFPPNFFLSGLPLWEPSQATSCTLNKNDNNKINTKQSSEFKTQPSTSQLIRVQNPLSSPPLPPNDSQQQPDNDKWDHVQVSKHIAMLQGKQTHATHHPGIAQIPSSSNQNNNLVQEPLAAAAAQAPVLHHLKPNVNPISDNESSSTMGLKQQQSKSSFRKSKQSGVVSGCNDNSTLPPFYLFDAPVELRHNFIQAQQAMNIPPYKDSNTVHYNMASNQIDQLCGSGFVNASLLPVTSTSNGDFISPDGKIVNFLDARQKKTRKGNERNEREQQRAAKITELIDKLRTTMVQGGWKVEMKSKYQTLSTCAEYVKHLISTAKEKEEKLAKTKADIAIRDQKLKEEKMLQEARSDPESVTSSITAFSSTSAHVQAASSPDINKASNNPKHSFQSTSESSSDQISSESGPKGKDFSVNKMSSSVSDMTDSNKGSADGKESKERSGNEAFSQKSGGETEVSSTAAVVSGIGSQEPCHQHTGLEIKMRPRDRKRKYTQEKNSLDENFSLNYEEVFMSSNVPQIIATLAGRVVTCNHFFNRLTGLSQPDMKRITIFSLVQAESLSTLYEVMANFLRKCNNRSAGDSVVPSLSSASDGKSAEDTSIKNNYETITLPCINFPHSLPLRQNDNGYSIFMHVSL